MDQLWKSDTVPGPSSQPDVQKMPQSTMSLVSNLRKSVVSSRNGLPISSMTSTSYLTCFPKVIWKLLVCSWWLVSRDLLFFLSRDVSNSLVILINSGPATIQGRGDWVSPIAPQSLFTAALFCSCAWSRAMKDNTRLVLRTVKLPFMNSMAASGFIVLRLTMSRIWAGIHLA